MTPIRKTVLFVAALAVIAFTQNVAQADPLVLSLQNNSFSITPGGSFTLVASAFNSGATNTNTDTITDLGGFLVGSFDASLTPFNTNFDNHSVANGNTLGPLAILTYHDTGSPEGSYTGSIYLEYSSGGGNHITNQLEFTVTVGSATSVPEPTTMLLLGTGLAGISAKLKRRRKQVLE